MTDALRLDSRPLSQENFAYVSELLQREAAIVMGAGKEYLVETRLAAVATRNHFASVNSLIENLRFSGSGLQPLHREVIDSLTTNETLFFRDFHPYEALRTEIVPKLLAGRPSGGLDIWSAACSTGQEPYSVAMLLADYFPGAFAASRILATDLCTSVLRRARSGLFQQLEVNRGLPASLLVRHFRQEPVGWAISDRLRERIEFREMNLAKPWPSMPRFDLIMIRNVMIYFDLPTRRRILEQARALMAPGGVLLLGGAETTLMVADGFVPHTVGRTTFYKRNGDD